MINVVQVAIAMALRDGVGAYPSGASWRYRAHRSGKFLTLENKERKLVTIDMQNKVIQEAEAVNGYEENAIRTAIEWLHLPPHYFTGRRNKPELICEKNETRHILNPMDTSQSI